MPTKRPLARPDIFQDMHFPKRGIDVSLAFGKQRPGTTPVGNNVRTFEPATLRARGGQRCGLVKYLEVRPGNVEWVTQELAILVGTEDPPPGGNMQLSQSGRVVTLVAVSQGNVVVANAGDTAWTAAANNTAETPPLNYSGIVYSSANLQKLWFADGTNWCYYDPFTNSVETWAATAGTLPVDGDGNTPRLICTWRGRIVLSGLLLDPQNWFMSAVGVPTDFDYSPLSISPAQAIAGNNAPAGLIGDVVTTLIPYTDDILVFGGDHSIYMMRGDPMAGGQIDLISDAIGMAWGEPWCKDPTGTLYFYANRTGIYSLIPGQAPQRISQPIDPLLQDVDTGANAIRLIWNDRFQGFHVFITPLDEPGPTTHFFYESPTGAWWTDTFANDLHNPLCCCVFDGNLPSDRVTLIGSWDGYVRAIDPTVDDDDGTAIESAVIIGPLLTKDLDDVLLKDVQAILAAESGFVNFAVYVGEAAEIALASEPVVQGTWGPGRNFSNFIRRSGHAIYVKITSTNTWAMETIRATIQGLGGVRRRGKS